MQLTAEIASLKQQLSEMLLNHTNLQASHKTQVETNAGLVTEHDGHKLKIAEHEKTIGEHAATIAVLQTKLAAAETKGAKTDEQIAKEVNKTLASTGVPAVKRDAAATNTPEGDAKPNGSPRKRLAAIFDAKINR